MKFKTITSGIIPLGRDNVDTDAIMPKQYLKMIGKTGYGKVLFDDWRYLDSGTADSDHSKRRPNTEFVLNNPKYATAKILVSGDNFGCGSSREHAVWGLVDYGIRVVIAGSFADIFYGNSINNGLLPLMLSQDHIAQLLQKTKELNDYQVTIDLSKQEIFDNQSWHHNFEINSESKKRLLEGIDEIDQIMMHRDDIEKYEEKRKAQAPWLYK